MNLAVTSSLRDVYGGVVDVYYDNDYDEEEDDDHDNGYRYDYERTEWICLKLVYLVMIFCCCVMVLLMAFVPGSFPFGCFIVMNVSMMRIALVVASVSATY